MLKAGKSGIKFCIDSKMSKIDSSLSDLVERILPLCLKYVKISEFIDRYSRYEHGLVNHALCAALRMQLKVDMICFKSLTCNRSIYS